MSVNQQHWHKYLRRINSYTHSGPFIEADYEQRLMKLIDIVYSPEELDAIAANE